MGPSYEDILEGHEIVRVSLKRARVEFEAHGVDDPETVAEFIAKYGDHKVYSFRDVLVFLGY